MTDGNANPATPKRLAAGRTSQKHTTSTIKSKEANMSNTTAQSAGSTAVRPFTIEIPEAELEPLRARLAAVRWPSRELVTDRSQGVQLATSQELARYWATDYDWRRCEARLNALP
jgi:hypothetical protein